VDGIMIECKDEAENAYDSIRFNDDDGSNVIDSRDLQNEKQYEKIISTVEGIIIDCNEEEENAYDSIRFNDDDLSNVIDSREVQCEKQCKQIISICDGIITELIEQILRISRVFA
jgi:hypothetical protein